MILFAFVVVHDRHDRDVADHDVDDDDADNDDADNSCLMHTRARKYRLQCSRLPRIITIYVIRIILFGFNYVSLS